jgi:putative membrane protein
MSRRSDQRRPAVFRLDDPDVIVAPAGSETPRTERVVVTPDLDDPALPVPLPPARRRRGIAWGTLFWSAAGGLVSLGVGLAVTRLIEDLFARAEWLGWTAFGLAVLAALALLVVTAREVAGLARLSTIEALRERAAAAVLGDDRTGAESVASDLLALARRNPHLARPRKQLQEHLTDIIDGADLVRLAERELMAPLDAEAKRLVAAAAKRVSVVTAVSPRAAVDLLFVFVTALMLVRRLAELYGGRPGALGLFRLMRMVIAHLAVTGGMAAGDSLVQQILGHGVAAKLSARLGEGVLNGLLTARLGLAAIDVTRPLPFDALPRPALTDLAGDLVRRTRDAET